MSDSCDTSANKALPRETPQKKLGEPPVRFTSYPELEALDFGNFGISAAQR